MSKADVFGTATISSTPVIDSPMGRHGTHIRAIYSSVSVRTELDAKILVRPKAIVYSWSKLLVSLL